MQWNPFLGSKPASKGSKHRWRWLVVGIVMVACTAGVAALVGVSVAKNKAHAASQQPQSFSRPGQQWQLPPPGSAAAEQLLASPDTPGEQQQQRQQQQQQQDNGM
jgi:flagellar basal body-associated protein FliL